MYKKDALREYIINSELRIFDDRIKVRLSKELVSKYDNGYYNNYLKNIEKWFNLIETLNIKYPGNATPIFYIYIVPNENYSELLNIPAIFDNGKGGGKPVKCYDLDGFNSAYGISENICENQTTNESISRIENEIHELAHIIHSQFFSKNQLINEGFAETLPLFSLNFEEIFDEHRNAILELTENQIFSAQEILNSEKNCTYGAESILPNKSCSFRLSYISSYLFVRGCIEKIIEIFNLDKIKATQYFLEIIKQSNSFDEYLIYDIADLLNISREELLNGKQVQLKALESISKQNKKYS